MRMSEMVTTQIPAVKPAGPPPSRRGRLRTRFDNMTPRARWLNLILILVVIIAVVLAITLIGNPSTPPVAVRTVAGCTAVAVALADRSFITSAHCH